MKAYLFPIPSFHPLPQSLIQLIRAKISTTGFIHSKRMFTRLAMQTLKLTPISHPFPYLLIYSIHPIIIIILPKLNTSDLSHVLYCETFRWKLKTCLYLFLLLLLTMVESTSFVFVNLKYI